MDVHNENISLAVRNAAGKIVLECVIETNVNTILQFFDGLRGELQVIFLLYMNRLKPVYHGDHGLRTLKELVRSYLAVTKDLSRVDRPDPGGTSVLSWNAAQLLHVECCRGSNLG